MLRFWHNRTLQALSRDVRAWVSRLVRSVSGVIRASDAVAANARAIVVEGDAWVKNQLLQNGDFADTGSWVASHGSLSVASNVLSFEGVADSTIGTVYYSALGDIINAHVYLAKYEVNCSIASNRVCRLTTRNGTVLSNDVSSGYSANAWKTISARLVATAASVAQNNRLVIQLTPRSSTDVYTAQLRNVQLVDLTQLCNGDATKIAAITSWADLVAQYPEYGSYVAYNAGEVVGLQSTVAARGRNLIDDSIKNNPSGTWTLIGSTTFGGGALLPPGTYYWNVYYNGGAMPSGVTPYISINGSASYSVHRFTLTEPSYVHCRIYPRRQDTTWSDYTAQVELGSTATAYEPYHDGGSAVTQTLMGVGAAHDTQDVVSGEVTRRIGRIVLDGTQSFGSTGDQVEGYFTTVYHLWEPVGPGSNARSRVISDWLPWLPPPASSTAAEGCYVGGSNNRFFYIRVPTAKATDNATLQSYLSQHPLTLYYELATPTTSTVAAQPLALQKGNNTLLQTDAGRTASFEMTYAAPR